MSQIPIDNDDNRSVAASDFVQLNQQGDFVDQEETQQQQQGQSQFGLHQSFWTMNSESTNKNYENGLKEHKLMIKTLEVFFGYGSSLPLALVIGIASSN
jgi:hypothetical protein